MTKRKKFEVNYIINGVLGALVAISGKSMAYNLKKGSLLICYRVKGVSVGVFWWSISTNRMRSLCVVIVFVIAAV